MPFASWFIIFIGSLILIAVYLTFAQAEAQETKYTHIGIEFSNTCLTLIDLGDVWTCSTPEEIQKRFIPTGLKSNWQIVFDNTNKDDPFEYQKANNIFNNHQKSCFYKDYCNVFDIKDGETVLYWYDFPNENRQYLDHTIIINTHLLNKNIDKSLDSIVINDGQNIGDDKSRYLALEVDRLHIDNCRIAMYDPEMILVELGSIIWYLEDNCKDKKKLGIMGIPFIEELVYSEYIPTESPAWLELQNLEALKTKYKGLMIGKD